ncbi:MAG: hypothetical protein A2984_01750 [Omnitrophica WOR_2 bacterium RIFCSPLOWO2_01_FULL_41_12]|nr:MAG: hypothetical protein A2984_01750 [Omnitrophica WOR_2 bacterium RIFCSPLOWO2_01_FULL_41_12]
MKKNSSTDYLAYILFKLIAPVIRRLPLNFSLFLARRLGELFYYLDVKHKAVARANIRNALGTSLSAQGLSLLTKEFYRTFAQNLFEVFFIPLFNKEYIHKYIRIEGLEHIEEGFKRGKGVILLSVHAGSWEFSNIICAILGFPFSLFIREQGFSRLNNLLNEYRRQKGCKIIQRQNGIRGLIRALKNNEAIGMTADQGGKSGTLVKFFAKNASMPSGAIKLALRYDAAVIPVFYTRIKGPYLKIFVSPVINMKKRANLGDDIKENLQEVVQIFERYISRYPKEYLWTYKIWKYSDEKNILILSDNKIGHLRQSEAVAYLLKDLLEEKGRQARINTVEVKNKKLSGERCDFVISCGASITAINLAVSRENLAKSIVIMRPSIFSVRRFDLVIMPKHDHPPRRRNVVVTEGALNLIDQNYLREQAQALSTNYELRTTNYYIGLLIGGNTKDFRLEKGTILEVIKQVKSVSESNNADILISTSRRTHPDTENLIKSEFKDYPRCKLLVIANEQNFPFTVGGILGLSKVVIVSAESISMISEAASSSRYIIVFKSKVNPRHNSFLNHLAKQGYIRLCAPSRISALIDELQRKQPKINILNDRLKVVEALKRII